jgi:pimeloyl-ACP methyl ester carboxylesterase
MTERFYWSRDGVRLHVREYAGPQTGVPTLLCVPGLTRNGRDFAHVAERLAGRYRVWCLDLRGRGESGWAKDPLTYVPLTYLQDIERLVDEFKPERLAVIGTSLGGILAMLMAGPLAQVMAGAVLNDVGPSLEVEGLARIRSYVGKIGRYPTWMHAARAVADLNRSAFPAYTLEDWLRMAKRVCRLEAGGTISFDYDPKIAEPFRLPGGEAGVDLWPAFDVLAKLPTLVIRGGLSDIFSAATLARMGEGRPQVQLCTVPGVGHAPSLEEPEAMAAIDAWLERL